MQDLKRSVPAPELFESAVLLCLASLYSVDYRRLCDDRQAVERALVCLDTVYGWQTQWTSSTTFCLFPRDGQTLDDAVREAMLATKATPDWCARAAVGVQPRIAWLRSYAAEQGVMRRPEVPARRPSASRATTVHPINAAGPIGRSSI